MDYFLINFMHVRLCLFYSHKIISEIVSFVQGIVDPVGYTTSCVFAYFYKSYFLVSADTLTLQGPINKPARHSLPLTIFF